MRRELPHTSNHAPAPPVAPGGIVVNGLSFFEPQPLYIAGHLPIRLRSFLNARLNPSLRDEHRAAGALDPSSRDTLMRELARAIRSFSAMRARERWAECAVALDTLERELREAVRIGRPVLLCFRCGVFAGAGCAVHRDAGCENVALRPASGTGPDSVREAIENYRARCEASGTPHHDLDCYIFNDQMIFTWRPLGEPEHASGPD